MNTDVSIADFVVHIHPELTVDQRAKIEEAVSNAEGVVSVHFSREHPNALLVAYDPEAISSEAVLAEIRKWDQQAVMASR